MSALAAYEAALTGVADCWVVERGGDRIQLPVELWRSDAGPSDETVLAAALASRGPVLDIGCGPGRLAAELGRRAVPALGIDVSAAAVAMARARGAMAQRRDVFGPLPGQPRWRCALLADGNIGIGGDPVALLRRCHEILAPDGIVVADLEVAEPGVRQRLVRLEAVGSDGAVGGVLPWATVGLAAATELGWRAGLRVRSVQPLGQTAVVVWEKETARV